MRPDTTFTADSEQVLGTLRVRVAGELDLSSEPVVFEIVKGKLEKPNLHRVVIDVTDVTFIDSSGLRALLRCRDEAARHDVSFTLQLGGNPQVERLLAVAGVESWFGYE